MCKGYKTSKEDGQEQRDSSYYPAFGFSSKGTIPSIKQIENPQSEDKGRRWWLWFLVFMSMAFFEMCIGFVMAPFYTTGYFFVYYNGFYTSIESMIWFGIAGCIGLRAVLTRYDLVRKDKKVK